jgi:hypothetical protein
VKNNAIILRGTRNPTDGLWDIPVQKQTMQRFNHSLPPIHPGMYPSSAKACVASSYLLDHPQPRNIGFSSHSATSTS